MNLEKILADLRIEHDNLELAIVSLERIQASRTSQRRTPRKQDGDADVDKQRRSRTGTHS